MSERAPRLVALAVAAVGLINLASAATGALPDRLALLLSFAPLAELQIAHALAVPAAVVLLGSAWWLAKRSHRAWITAVTTLLVLSALDLMKGLDVEEAAISAVLAVALWRFEDQFTFRRSIRRLRRDAQDDRQAAAAVVRAHGADTLSAFKLRADVQRFWSVDRRAFVGYRVEGRTLLVSGDPVGDATSVETVWADLRAHARLHGLRLAVLGASEATAEALTNDGMRRVYIGDEALVPTGTMNLSGRRNASLRKAVNRLARNGYTACVTTVAELDDATRMAMTTVSDRWRGGAPERGFSMAPDVLFDPLLDDCTVVLGRDATGTLRGFLHFAPAPGSDLLSLAFMRRDRDTPNGLMDFLVVEAARQLEPSGIRAFSLNFATCGRWLRTPERQWERLAARLLRAADRWFQLERLLRFNAKFDPIWQPRYLLCERPAQLPAVAVGVLQAEGWLPRTPAAR